MPIMTTHDVLHEHGREHLPSRDKRFLETVRFLTAFEAAAAEGELPLIELLLVDGMDVNARDADGRTLLSWAAQRGHADAAELLLRHGAEVNVRDRTGKTPLSWAVRAKHPTVAQVLRQHGGVQ
jgi:ankyrin repeat protein